MPKGKKTKAAKVHTELKGLDIRINSFGEITASMDIEKINKFLDDHVEDKKLTDSTEPTQPTK